jgi:hypothetical protein
MKLWLNVKGIIINMIEKAIAYKKNDKDFISSLKKLDLSEDEINFILKKSKRKKFEDGGDSGGSDSGPGGSDDGSGHGGPGTGSTGGPGGAEGGFGIGPDAESEAAASNAAAAAAAAASGFSPDIGGIVGPGPGQVDTTGFGTSYSDLDMGPVGPNAMAGIDMSMPALQTREEKAMAQARNTFSPMGILGGLLGMMSGLPGGFGLGSKIGSNIGRGVTAPDDFSQLNTSVQIGPAQDSIGGDGILNIYAPLTNSTTGDNTRDALLARYMSYLRSQRNY